MSKISQLNDLLERYATSGGSTTVQAELEVRFKNVTRDMFETVLAAATKTLKFLSIEQTVNTLSRDDVTDGTIVPTYIRRQMFDNKATKINDVHASKTQIVRGVYMPGFVDYSINLSAEKIEKPMPVGNNAEVRIKKRISFELTDSWRLDLTAVKQGELNEIGHSLKTIVKTLFTSGSSGDGADTASGFKPDYTYINAFEIECEHTGNNKNISTGDIDKITKLVFSVISPTYLSDQYARDCVRDVAADVLTKDDPRIKNAISMKRFFNNPLSITYSEYADVFARISDFVITEKADGVRCIIRASAGSVQICSSRDSIIIGKPGPVQTIVDAELIDKSILVFDILMHEGNSVVNENFVKRIGLIDSAVTAIAKVLSGDNTYTIAAKKFVQLSSSGLEKQFKSVWNAKRDYDTDGLMLIDTTTLPNDYFNTIWYKWKPLEKNTIDFLAVKMDPKLTGIKPFIMKPGYDLYILFVGIDAIMRRKLGLEFIPKYSSIITTAGMSGYVPIQFCPSINPTDYIYYHKVVGSSVTPNSTDETNDLHMKIVEMKKSANTIESDWEIVRVRNDRKIDSSYYGNDFKTAELTYQNFVNVLGFEDLYNYKSDDYFTKTANTDYKAKNGFNRFVISNTICKYGSDVKYAIDLAAGRGADIDRFKQCRVGQCLFIDVDISALTELIRRKFSTIVRDRNQRQRNNDVTMGMTTHVFAADLKSPADTIIANITKFGAFENTIDYINCSFALHYFCDTVDNIRNIVKLVGKLLKRNGVFTFCVLNGAEVFKRLANIKVYNFSDVDTDTPDKYVIMKKYSGSVLADVGQTIGIKLPFADAPYTEPLCNIAYVIKEFKAAGFALESNNSFATYLSDFQSANRIMYNSLTPTDHAYIALHNVVALKLVKPQISSE